MSNDQTERIGVEAVRAIFARLGWFVREPVRPDYGVDLFVETATEVPTGRLLALQVKSGASYIGEGDGDIAFRADQKHIDYWKGHSLPVIVVLYDPTAEVAYWQAITDETAESTGKGWKLIVPRAQVIDEKALPALAALAAPEEQRESPQSEALERLRADLTWMEVLEAGGTVTLDAREWINKSSGRGDLTLTATPGGGGETVEREFVVLLGSEHYAEALPRLFPWADLKVNEDLLDEHDEDLWMEETGIWDSEDKAYVGNVETLDEWRQSRYPDGALRPYKNAMDEVDFWRLDFRLNDLGRGILALERFASQA